MIAFTAHFLSEKVQSSIVFCCYGCVWKFLAFNNYAVYEIMSVYMCVKQKTDDSYYVIVYNLHCCD